jgi:hypothetical protein
MATALPASDWPAALRSACLAGALGLGELAGIALDAHARGLHGDTRDVVEAARRLLPPPDDEIERLTGVVGREPRWAQPVKEERGGLLDESVVVALEEPIEGAGWREPHQRSSDRPVRFMGPGRRAWIDLPLRLPPACAVELVVVSDDLGHCNHLALEVNGIPVEVQWSARDGARIGTARLPEGYTPRRPFTRIAITTPEPVPRPGSDPRKLGIGLSEVWLRPPEPPDGA